MSGRLKEDVYKRQTFCDLLITGIVGLRPRADQTIEVRPIIPAGKWQYFCLDKVRYHGHDLTILYDQGGSRYHVGKGCLLYTSPAEEHVPPSRTLMQVSEDGYNWSQPQILFPEY